MARAALVAGAFVVAAIVVAVVLMVTTLLTWIVAVLVGTDASLVVLGRGAANVWPLSMLFAGLAALACGRLHRSAQVTAIATGTLVGMYVIDLVGKLAEPVEPLRHVSAFRYYGSAIQDGIDPLAFAGVTLAGIVLAVCRSDPAPAARRARMIDVVERLLASSEPAVRLRAIVGILGLPPDSPEAEAARAACAGSERVSRLLSERRADGTIPFHPYNAKWYGAHWVLVTLAELGYPPGDRSLVPLREQALGWLLSDEYERRHIGRVHGLTTLHASIEGNAVWALQVLGLADERVDRLVARLLQAQWPDGGWNCDRHASGRASSFTESLIPLRALVRHADATGDGESRRAAARAAELFLTRGLYRRRTNGRVIHASFLKLHHPCYWHYDILFALTVLAEAGLATDPRCREALELLAAKRLADGGFPAEARFYRVSAEPIRGTRSIVDWGPTGVRRSNEWVTASALAVLSATDEPKDGCDADARDARSTWPRSGSRSTRAARPSARDSARGRADR